MKLNLALEIGKDCMLESVGESMYNIDLRAGQLFAYSEIDRELEEMYEEYTSLKNEGLIDLETDINEALKVLSTREGQINND